jgi:hypothetical protein
MGDNPWVKKTYEDRVQELRKISNTESIKAAIVIIGIFASAFSFLAAFAFRDTIKDGITILGSKIETTFGVKSKFLMTIIIFTLTIGVAVGGIYALDKARTKLENEKALIELKEKFMTYCNETFITLQTQSDVNVKRDIYNNNKQCHNKQKMKEHVQCADMLEQIKEKTEAERSQFLMDNRSTFVHDTCYNKSDFDKLLNNV